MVPGSSDPAVGSLVRDWRERRRLSQMDLALDAGVSARHLSCVETGRAKPGRALLLRLFARLDVPFREQNTMLLAGGYAPEYVERPLDGDALAPVRAALDLILATHDPYPAVVVDRGWNLITANAPMLALAALADVDPVLLRPPVNILRVGFHPRGLAPMLDNLGDWRAHFLGRLERQAATTGDPALAELHRELAAYQVTDDTADPDREILGPLKVRGPGGAVLSFLGMFATFDTPFEVTSSELAIELLFPVDEVTTEALERLAARRG